MKRFINKITIGITHDYIEFKETKGNIIKNIQLPIIYANEFLKLLKESGYCNDKHIFWNSEQASYDLEVDAWIFGIDKKKKVKFIPKTKQKKVISKIMVVEK